MWILDLPALKYSIMINGVIILCIMKADVLDSFDDIYVLYKLSNRRRKNSTTFHLKFLKRLNQCIFEFQGWNTDITKLKDKSNLPEALLNYIQYLEEELEVPIINCFRGAK